MNITKNTKKVYNFGVTSEFSKVLLKRAAEKLNPNKVDGSVSNFARQYLQTFSNWAPSMGISDDLRKYQLPLPVGVYESVPDSAGLTRAELENKLFDEALKNAIIEISEGIIPEVKGVFTTFHFAKNGASEAPGEINLKNKSEPQGQSVDQNDNVPNDTNGGGLGSFIDLSNPAHVAALTGLSSSALSYLAADKKKRKSGKAWKDAVVAGIIGGGSGYVGSKIFNSNTEQNNAPTQEQPQEQQSKPQEQQPPSTPTPTPTPTVEPVKPDVQTNNVKRSSSAPTTVVIPLNTTLVLSNNQKQGSTNYPTTVINPKTNTENNTQATAGVIPQKTAVTPQAKTGSTQGQQGAPQTPTSVAQNDNRGTPKRRKGSLLNRRQAEFSPDDLIINTIRDAKEASGKVKYLYKNGIITHETLEKSFNKIAERRREIEATMKKNEKIFESDKEELIEKEAVKLRDDIKQIFTGFDIKTQEGANSAIEAVKKQFPGKPAYVDFAINFIEIARRNNIPIEN